MKTTWTTLSVALAASLLAVEAQAADFARNPRPTNPVARANVSTAYNLHQGNLGSPALRSSSQLLMKQSSPSGPTNLGAMSTANKYNTLAAKNSVGKLNLNTLAAKNSVGMLNLNAATAKNSVGMLNLNAVIVKNPVVRPIDTRETTPGLKDPRTGKDLSKDPASGLPGGKDISKQFPSAEKQWNDRIKGSLGGGGDYLNDGTPFDDKPGSDPMDDFFSQHAGNIPDPLAAFGSGRSSFSPADDTSGGSGKANKYVGEKVGQIMDSGKANKDVGESIADNLLVYSSMFCASDYVGKENLFGRDDCIIIAHTGNNRSLESPTHAVDFVRQWFPNKGLRDQQYEGEGGYTGGGGRSANDLYVGSTARMTGKVVGGRDPGAAGLGQDTGARMPAICEAIEKYVSLGGKVRGGKSGFQGTDSGLGQDLGGTAEKRISGVKKALDAQRFSVDRNMPNPDEVPWQLREVVSPTVQASAAQASLQQGVQIEQANTTGK
jgi:hypothetical protein